MTERSLSQEQRWTLEIIEKLGFGRIEQLSIRNGKPCFDPAPRIVEEIRLASHSEQRPDLNNNPDLTLKKEFAKLFDHLERLREGTVDIEIRHYLPFRLVVQRNTKGLVP